MAKCVCIRVEVFYSFDYAENKRGRVSTGNKYERKYRTAQLLI